MSQLCYAGELCPITKRMIGIVHYTLCHTITMNLIKWSINLITRLKSHCLYIASATSHSSANPPGIARTIPEFGPLSRLWCNLVAMQCSPHFVYSLLVNLTTSYVFECTNIGSPIREEWEVTGN